MIDKPGLAFEEPAWLGFNGVYRDTICLSGTKYFISVYYGKK